MPEGPLSLQDSRLAELKATDARLAELLARRVALLAGLDEAPTPIGHFVWQGVCELTAAAALHASSLKKRTPISKRIAIVGKRGVTGSFFARRLEELGHKVEGFGRSGWDSDGPAMLRRAELVIVSVPPVAAPEIIRRTAQHMRPEAVLADVTSIKLPAFRAMMESHSGPVVGLHPMFGPGAESFLAQVVVVCHGRSEESYRWFLDELASDGATLVETTPEEHDRVMIAVQAIRHFATMLLGRFLAEEGVDIPKTLQFASPPYRLEMDLVGRLFAQDPALYIDIILASPERKAAISRLAETCARLAREVASEDRASLAAEFEAARKAFGEEAPRALEESNRLLELFVAFLAAQRMRTAQGKTGG